MANPARAYLATQVETTTQGELLIMLYEAAIKFLKRANIEIDNKDYAKKGIYISKAMAIIHELAESLNREKGGDITPKLLQLYMFCTSQLIKANIRLDKKMVSDVISIMEGLRSAYAQIVPQHNGTVPAHPAPTTLPVPPGAPQETDAPPAAPQQAAAYGKSAVARPDAPEQATTQPAAAQAAPEPAPTPPSAVQPSVQPAPTAPQATTPQPQQSAAPQEPAAEETTPKESAPPPTPPAPPKLRTAFNAAKFRAANAYTNNT